jgi:uncharacterized protein (TIGR00369 family)
MVLIYKICPMALWLDAQQLGAFRGAPIDRQDGYIHLSTAAQLAGTAAKHFAGQAELLLLSVDEALLGPALRYEPSRGGDLFPHLYGSLPLSAVTAVEPLPLGPEGRPVLPPAIGAAAAARSEPSAPAGHGWRTKVDPGLMGLIGPVWIRGERHARRYGFVVEPRHMNRSGAVHGGMLMAFADEVLGRTSAIASGGRTQATIQLDTHFVAPAREGEFVEAEGRIVRQTRSIMFLDGSLTVGDRVVATAHGVWKLRGEPRP